MCGAFLVFILTHTRCCSLSSLRLHNKITSFVYSYEKVARKVVPKGDAAWNETLETSVSCSLERNGSLNARNVFWQWQMSGAWELRRGRKAPATKAKGEDEMWKRLRKLDSTTTSSKQRAEEQEDGNPMRWWWWEHGERVRERTRLARRSPFGVLRCNRFELKEF